MSRMLPKIGSGGGPGGYGRLRGLDVLARQRLMRTRNAGNDIKKIRATNVMKAHLMAKHEVQSFVVF
jgi:hypothetical protein